MISGSNSGTDSQMNQYMMMGLLSNQRNAGEGISAILHYLYVPLILFMTPKISGFISFIFEWVFENNKKIYYWFLEKTNKYVSRSISVSNFMDNGKENKLYTPYEWYLSKCISNDNNVQRSVTLESNIDFRINDDAEKYTKRILPTYATSEFTFEGKKITFSISRNVKTFNDGDENKQDYFTYRLHTKMLKREDYDIFNNLNNYIVKEWNNFMSPENSKIRVYQNNKKGEWVHNGTINKRDFNTIIMQNDKQYEIKKKIINFANSEEKCNKMGIPYKDTYLFTGEPGTGKTSSIIAIASELSRDIYYLNLNNVEDDDKLTYLLSGQSIDYKKSILVIEDIDCSTNVTNNRNVDNSKNVSSNKNTEADIYKELIVSMSNKDKNIQNNDTKKNSLTLACLLNNIDGIMSTHGRILIITTNYPEKLDFALIRPGRVNKRYHFEKCNKEQIKKIFSNIYEIPYPEDMEHILVGDKYSPAYIANHFWNYNDDYELALDRINDDYDIILKEKQERIKNLQQSEEQENLDI